MKLLNLLLVVLLLSINVDAKLKGKKKKGITVETYNIPYYGLCENSKCQSDYYCLNGKCIENLKGEKGSYCGFWNFIYCGKGLSCEDNICIDTSKNSVIKFVKAY